jgi:hypothetical protein
MQIKSATHHHNFFMRNYYQHWSDTQMNNKFCQLYSYLFIDSNPGISNDRVFSTAHIYAILKRYESELKQFNAEEWERVILKNPLLHCPFCGLAGIAIQHEGIKKSDGSISMKGLWYVGCPDLNDEYCIRPSASWFADLREAVLNWNMRKNELITNNQNINIKVCI